MRVFDESLFNKFSNYDYKDLNYMDNVESTDDFINNMKSFGVEFDETDIKVLESISVSDSIEEIRLKLNKVGLEIDDEGIKEVISKLKQNNESYSLSDEDLENINGGYTKMMLFAIGLVTLALGGVSVGAVGYGTCKVVKSIKNKITGTIKNKKT